MPQAQKDLAAGQAKTPQIEGKIPPWGFLEWFAIGLTLFPAILFLPGTQALRVPIRMLPFGLSLFGMVRQGAGTRRVPSHPAKRWLSLVVLYLSLSIMHPTTNSLIAGLAQTMLYFSVMAPVFWAPSLVRSGKQLKRLLWILLICNGANSVVGVLQVYDPSTWMPKQLSEVVLKAYADVSSMTYTGASGQRILRPTGLSDNPGYVSAPGMYAAMLGLIFCAAPLSIFQKLAAFGFAFAGLSVIYLTWVRAALITLAAMSAAYSLRLIIHKWKMRAILFMSLAGLLLSVSYRHAVSVGGTSLADRFATLFAANPLTVYQASQRTAHLDLAFNRYIFEYPLGAGLGRWGMMNLYFGENNPESPAIWTELQITGWVIDGGIVLLLLYCLALGVNTFYEYRLVRLAQNTDIQFWAASVLAINAGTLSLLFDTAPFLSQIGMQYWLLAGVLHGAQYAARDAAHERLPNR